MGLGATVVEAMLDELTKIAAASSSSIVATPSPAGDYSGYSKSMPGTAVKPVAVKAKALGSTNLSKTNYTRVQSHTAPPADVSLTSEQKALTPPVVRSS